MSVQLTFSDPSQATSYDFFHAQFDTYPSIQFSIGNDVTDIDCSLESGHLDTHQGDTVQKLVIVCQTMTFEMLNKILFELKDYSNQFVVSKHIFSGQFSETVIDVTPIDLSQTIPNDRLSQLSRQFHVDISVKSNARLNEPGLIVFDMDSTVIEMECIDEIAKLAGVGKQVAEVTERAMQGEIAFSDSLLHRVACLKGVELSKLQSIRDRLPFSPGFATLVTRLKQANWTIAIASGGFTYFADHIKHMFDLDVAKSNELKHEKGLLTGEVIGEIVDAQKKADQLLALAESISISKTQTLAVGDGANDLVMMSAAGFGVAYHAKPKVQVEAQGNIQFSGLQSILYLLQ